MLAKAKIRSSVVLFGAGLWFFASQIGILEQFLPSLHESVHSHFETGSFTHEHPIEDHQSHKKHTHSDSKPDDHAHNPFFFTSVNHVFYFVFAQKVQQKMGLKFLPATLSFENRVARSEFYYLGLHPPPKNPGFQFKSEVIKLPISANGPPVFS